MLLYSFYAHKHLFLPCIVVHVHLFACVCMCASPHVRNGRLSEIDVLTAAKGLAEAANANTEAVDLAALAPTVSNVDATHSLCGN